MGLAVLLLAGAPRAAQAQTKPATAAPSPAIEVTLRNPRYEGPQASRALAKRLGLEAGAVVRPTCFLDPETARTNRERYILLAVQKVEGGYDAVNLYDRGILSWGMMQWAAHSNSLQEALWYVKQRLIEKNKAHLWVMLFKEQGLDVQRLDGTGAPAFYVGGTNRVTGVTSWRPVTGIDDLRVLFRGTKTPGKYDTATITRWAKVFARAGRNPVVQTLQEEWATARLRACLAEKVTGGRPVTDYTGGDLFSDALYFAFWTNNPAAAREHFTRAVAQAKAITGGEPDPTQWPPALFPFLLETTGRRSTFGTWPSRTEQVAEVIGAGGVGRQLAATQLASRGWNLGALGRGTVGRAGRGQLWRRPAKPTPSPSPSPKGEPKQEEEPSPSPAPEGEPSPPGTLRVPLPPR